MTLMLESTSGSFPIGFPAALFPFSPPSSGAQKDEEAPSGPVAVPPRRRRILVVDDERSIADSLTEILESHGFEATACYSGQAAIEHARKHCPDLVLSDVLMPKLNGIDTVLAICKLCPRTRVMLISGQASTKDLLAQARAHGHSFELLPKPIHPDQLLAKLKALDKDK